MKLDELLESKNKLEQFLLNYDGEPIALYGAGDGLIWYVKLAEKYRLNLVAITASNVDDNKREMFGYPLIKLDDLLKEYKNMRVIISAPAYADEISELLSQRMNPNYIYSFDASIDVLQNRNMGEYKKFLSSYKEEIENFQNSLFDDRSKVIFLQVLAGWITYDLKCFEGLCEGIQYFPDFICDTLGKDEVFVDLGAYTGDSIIDFMGATGDRFDKIFAFEPDSINAAVLNERISDERIHVFEQAVSDKNETLYFVNENDNTIDPGAHIVGSNENGKETVAVALDEVIRERITYLKMDIEGSELAALKGSESLIRKYRPKMAVCLYHKQEDIIEIPRFIAELNMNYKLFLRHYWNCSGTDLVLYCL